VFTVAAEAAVVQLELKKRVTVEDSDDVPKTVGNRLLPRLPGLTELNVKTGTTLSKVTELSVEVDAELPLPKTSVTVPAAIDGITVP
jgi:hypothetical protein